MAYLFSFFVELPTSSLLQPPREKLRILATSHIHPGELLLCPVTLSVMLYKPLTVT